MKYEISLVYFNTKRQIVFYYRLKRVNLNVFKFVFTDSKVISCQCKLFPW